MKKAAKNLSDKELQGLLASLKEEVAAPSNFRARVLKAVVLERGLKPGLNLPKAEPKSWFSIFSRPLLVPVAAVAVLGFAVWFVAKPEAPTSLSPEARTERGAEGARVEVQPSKLAAVSNPVIAVAPERAGTRPAQPAPVVASLEQGAGTRTAPTLPETAPKAPASLIPQIASSGSSAAAPSAAHAADISPDPKPTIIIVTPAPTPMLKPLNGNSEVRRNKFLASRGEYAAVLYALKASQAVRIEIYSRAGALVAVLQDGTQAAGQHEIHWFGYDDQGALLPSGIYLLRIHSADYDERHKLVLIR